MSKRLLIKTCILLAVTTSQAQYVDFFQSFNTFLQPYTTTTKPKNEATRKPETKHRQTTKQKYQDVLFFETDDFLKQRENSQNVDPFNIYSTTQKPRRKSTKSSTSHNHSTTSKPKLDNSNKVLSNNHRNNQERSVSNSNPENNIDNRAINNGRRIDNYNNNLYNNGYSNYNVHNIETTKSYTQTRPTTQAQRTTNYYNNRLTTTTRRTNFYNSRLTTNYDERTTPRYDYYNKQTNNPLLNRPGVKPAAVDENQPPITNRPITSKPYDPSGSYRPNTRPDLRPVNTRPPINPRPVNTRPPFEPERPISTGVARPYDTDRPNVGRPYNMERPNVARPYDTERPNIARPYDTERPNIARPYDTERPNIARPYDTERPNVGRPYETEKPRPVSNENTEIDIEIGPDEDEMGDAEKRRLYDICEQKCEEYKSMRVKKVVALPLAAGQPSGVELNVSSCAPDTVPLIIGGQLARIEAFPHMALLGWKNIQDEGYKWKCGGSLVSERYVLTAGHCIYHDKDYNVVSGPPTAAQLGSSVYGDHTATVVQISLVVRHPKYKLRRSYYDVALLKLAVDVTFSDKIMPACLGVPPPVGEPIIATGWGKTEFGGDSSIVLRSVSIPVWEMSDCQDIWGTSLKLPNGPMPDNQICAGASQGGKDTCQGDSGGPAQVRDGCTWRVVAVTSVGRSCGARETPALYARVPRAFVAKQIFTNTKPGRDGSSQYGNQGTNPNNNNRNNENNNGNNASNNQSNGNNNNNDNQPNNSGVINTPPLNSGGNYNNNPRLPNNNNGHNYNNGNNAGTTNTGQYYGNSNNWGVTNNNNGYNYNTNAQTTNGYNSHTLGQNNNKNIYSLGNNENPSDIRNYDPQNFAFNNNGGTVTTYNRDNNDRYNSNNRYNVGTYPVANRPWWTK